MTGETLYEIAEAYAVGICAAWRESNPAWAERDGFDLFLGKVVSLMGELSVELGQDVELIALDHAWLAVCYRTASGWHDLEGRAVAEGEVSGMVQAGAWMVLSDGVPWRYEPPAVN